ncbi:MULTISPECIES: shikimate dehydrogenase [Nocardioides]|uniref:Shikimate dehydrogenase n=1 Tax=Nocardioides vastitatis TaxID=2568655 RepID=A0ABW0ZKK2_9ACTN|nr:shikimate dehydrogenase [Nocardioides sp.]THJ07309.1 shikimate dehydrogenase [Nocardioides sp.]
MPDSARRCAVLGDPIDHSLSPVLHRAGYEALRLDFEYDAVRVPSGELAGFVAGLGPEWRGLSVTAPLKREALDLADEVSETARLAGAVNTLVRTESGWLGENTDVPGAVAAIRERFGTVSEAATIIGGGATAASVGLALAELGIEQITLLVRDPANAAAAAAAIRRHPAGPGVEVVRLDQAAPAEGVLVSTVPATAQTPDLVARLLPVDVVFDVTYHPWPTPLVEAAAAEGVPVVSGLDLLVHQAVLQFGIFTGHDAPLAAMREAGERALAAR